MSNMFGPQKPNDNLPHLWRVIFSLVIILVVLAVTFFFHNMKIPSELEEISVVFESLEALSENEAIAGGDLIISRPSIESPRLPELKGELLPEEDFSAKSIIVKDHESGMILYKKNEYDVRSIASITKLMSALVLLEKNPDWSVKTTVIGGDSLGTHMYAGDTYTLDELWHAALVGSSNKAILTLANALDWPIEAFVERMNQKANELGMTETNFVEPTGLDEGNKSNASNLAILLKEALRHDKIKEAVLTSEYTLFSEERQKSHHMWNTNWLLLGWVDHDFSQILGGKTGYTNAAGYSFVTQVANADDHIIDVVVLGTNDHESRFTEAKKAADMVFENYTWPTKNGASHFE